MNEGDNKEGTVTFRLGIMLLQTAMFFDGLQWITEATEAIPGAGQVLAFVLGGLVNGAAFLIMGAILYFSGFSIFNLRRGGSLIVTNLIELIPLVKVLPVWTLWATVFILTNQAEAIVKKHPGVVSAAAKIFDGKSASTPPSPRVPPSTPPDSRGN